MVIYDLNRLDEDNDFHVSWCLFDSLSEALQERDRLKDDPRDTDFVVLKRTIGRLDIDRFKPYMEWEDVDQANRSAE